jgi:hypothetical protein
MFETQWPYDAPGDWRYSRLQYVCLWICQKVGTLKSISEVACSNLVEAHMKVISLIKETLMQPSD